ncbi:MAG: PilW family protein [Candidatus Thiodiazotropha sp. (ex Dulcina madagascariensis)]|nr:PilW family protein [Candidatus Thiodiazotropha sp. (ex Dulcina madagascariensis)]MCU7926030.1 PilW family protein [Candidatus Thiodiazotropha sp. (ex Dulcina madagascariensis)]
MMHTIRKQAGFSILSLMIASAIGVFLMGGAGKVYVDSKAAFNARSAIATATEGNRFSIQDLRRTLVMAGRGIIAADDSPGSYQIPDNGRRTFPAVDSNGIVDVDANGSSVIAIRYAEGPAPCGQAGTLASTKTVRFFIDNDSNLTCQVVEDGLVQPFVSDVIVMRALYGVDTDSDGIANQYRTATQVGADNRWINVVTIRIGLITSSGDMQELPVAYRPPAEEDLDLLGWDYELPGTAQFYKSASTTIAFRNLHTTISRQ